VSHILPVDTSVTVYFDVPTTPVFILDDPVAGKLDDTTYVLAGDTATDITSDVTTVSVQRGRSRWLDQIQVGTASFVARNLDRDFDPFGAGAYSANIVPGKRVTIDVGSTPVFDGLIDDWDLRYTLNGDATATAIASDPLAEVGRSFIASHTTTSQLSGARIDAILDRPEIDFPAAERNIATGLETMQADTIAAGTNTLDYLKLVTETESGRLFAARDGVLTFQQRSTPISSTDLLVFADDGSGIAYDDIEVQVGSELLFNRATVTRLGGTAQTEDNTASQELYGIRTLERDGLLFNSDAAADSLAEFLVNKYGDATPRFATLQVNLARLTVAECIDVVALELGEAVHVKFTPPGGGAQVDQYGIVEGIRHDVSVDRHRVTFSLSSLADAPFVLDDAVFGILDGDAVLSY